MAKKVPQTTAKKAAPAPPKWGPTSGAPDRYMPMSAWEQQNMRAANTANANDLTSSKGWAYINGVKQQPTAGPVLGPPAPGKQPQIGPSIFKVTPEMAAFKAQQEKNKLTNDLVGQRYAGQGLKDFLNSYPGWADGFAGDAPPTPSPGGGGSGGGGSGSSGGGGGSATPEDPLAAISAMVGQIDPSLLAMVPTTGELEAMYAKLQGNLNTQSENVKKSYDESIAAINKNFADSNNMLQKSITGDEAALAQAAANMGVTNWSTGATSQGNTDYLNEVLGANSANKATDLSWFEKMKDLDAGQFSTISALFGSEKQKAIEGRNATMLELQQLANQQAQGLALQELMATLGGGSGGGGGGGGRRYGGGGGGSSGKSPYATATETGSETQDQTNPIIAETLDALAQINPGLADWAWEQWFAGDATPAGAVQRVYDQRNALGNINQNRARTAGWNTILQNAGLKLPAWTGGGQRTVPKPATGYGADVNNWNMLKDLFMSADPTSGTKVSRSYDTKNVQGSKYDVPTTVPQNWLLNQNPGWDKPKPKAPKPTLKGKGGGSGWGQKK